MTIVCRLKHVQLTKNGRRHGCDQVEQYRQELRRGGPIDMANLKAFAFHGIPDKGGLRATAWKVRFLFAFQRACKPMHNAARPHHSA